MHCTTLKQVVGNVHIVRTRYIPGCKEKSAAVKDKAPQPAGAAAESCEVSQSECKSQDENLTDDKAGLEADLYVDFK